MKYVFLSLSLAVSLLGQEAKVVQLERADADSAKAAYDALKKAEANWQMVMREVEHKYVSDSREEVDYGTSGTSLNVISGDANTVLRSDGLGHLVFDAERHDPCSAGSEYGQSLCDAWRKLQQERRAQADRKEKERQDRLPKKTVYTPKSGWNNGFEFSPDFHFIVPKPAPAVPQWRGWGANTPTVPTTDLTIAN